MSEPHGPRDLEQMLDRIAYAERTGGERTTLEGIVTAVGRRAFGPLLLVPGIITLMPIVGDIPGVPTLMALLVLVVAVQLLLGRDYFWLPDFLLKRSVERDKVRKSLKWTRPPARFMDRFFRPRLAIFTRGIGVYAVALVCIGIALTMPPMEFIPFSANGAGLALTLFGLALMAHDGLMALIAFATTIVTWALVLNFV
ncbi:MAG: exopolysaccharide biosynthesis protein [Alteromonadaceae bacterium]|nr:exopolysaccharide biosynthesis protein [Alteromonadaceae bacterium]